MDRAYILSGLSYAILGGLLGVYMASTHNHIQHVTHAHIMLVGFVISFVYGLCHKLWLSNTSCILAKIQFFLHQGAAVTMLLGLFVSYGQYVPYNQVEAILIATTFVVLIAMLLMLILVYRSKVYVRLP
jgi:hypothetical protein